MFKLESYITPLILSRVEKYVKNVRTEDSQVYKCFFAFYIKLRYSFVYIRVCILL